jgi:hypothetical protein
MTTTARKWNVRSGVRLRCLSARSKLARNQMALGQGRGSRHGIGDRHLAASHGAAAGAPTMCFQPDRPDDSGPPFSVSELISLALGHTEWRF